MKFGDILRDLLEEHNLSQKKFAEALNISASAVGNYVRNNREPDFETLKQIARYFHTSTDFLLSHQRDQEVDYRAALLLEIFQELTDEQKELYLEQGKLFIKSNQKKRTTSFPSAAENKAV